jgi:hypothetical protein
VGCIVWEEGNSVAIKFGDKVTGTVGMLVSWGCWRDVCEDGVCVCVTVVEGSVGESVCAVGSAFGARVDVLGAATVGRLVVSVPVGAVG